MIRVLLGCMISLVIGLSSTAQVKDPYVEGTLLIKVKENYRGLCKEDAVDLPILKAAMEGMEVTLIKKRFPHATPLVRDRAPDPQAPPDKRVDISLIYEIHYKAKWDVRKAAQQLMRTNALVYAEPWYIPQAIVTPDDELIDSLWHLPIINAEQGWSIDTGSSDIVIAIVDTGVDKDHPDLIDKLWVNENEIPGNGVDDDGNGYIDDVQGWNFHNDNNDINETGFSHGTHVAGLAGASTNNGIGIAGTGWACTIMGIKAGDKLQLPYGYDGVVYAAERGADVINCSWGSFGSNAFAHDIIRYATYNLNALVVGGAGNDNREDRFYPASYQEVLSVGGSDQNDRKSDFSNYNYDIDLLAPGTLIFSLKNGGYGYDSGTSMSAPIAAGVAGLVRHRFPDLSALQVMEQLRVTADTSIFSISENTPYEDKLGTGRLDLFRAVEAISSPGLRIDYHEISDGDDEVFVEDETVYLGMEIVNYLLPMEDITVTIESEDPQIEILMDTWEVGDLGEKGRLNNLISPLEIKILEIDSYDVEIDIKVTATGSSTDYKMVQYLSFLVNPSYVNVNVNNIRTTVSKHGLVGFTDLFQTYGQGFQLENVGNLVYEIGLMIGHENEVRKRVVDRVRSDELYDRDFWEEKVIERMEPESQQAYLAAGSFTDSSARLDEIGLHISQRALAFDDPGHQNYVIIEYSIENRSGKDLYNMTVGMFADWDINDATQNKAVTVFGKRMGYIYYTGGEEITAGIQALGKEEFVSYMIDNVQGGNGGIDMYDEEDYSSRRKYKSMTENRPAAGSAGETGEGNDVIQVSSMRGINIKDGEVKTFAFAIHGGRTTDAVLESADSAYVRYFGYAPGEDVEGAFELGQLWPNPTNGALYLDLAKRRTGQVDVYLYDSYGRLIRSFDLGQVYAGANKLTLELPDLETGNYFLEFEAEGSSEIRPIVFIAQ